jgi:TPR repeat protein
LAARAGGFALATAAGTALGYERMKAGFRKLLVAFLVTVAFAQPAIGGPLEDGVAAYQDKAYAKAAEFWRPLAEKGDPAAQYLLGALYMEGKGVERDDAIAVMWFQRAANQGDARAQYNLGASYAEGAGVQKSEVEAAKWFQRAADQGMVFAQVNLALLYAAGKGVPQDNVEAFKWLELAFSRLPAGGTRSDVARAMTDVAAKMTRDELDEAKLRERRWKVQPEVKTRSGGPN